MSRYSKIFSTTIVIAIAGCASLPNGPNVMVLPGTGKSFESFRSDDTACEQYAYAQVGGTRSNQVVETGNTVNSALGPSTGMTSNGRAASGTGIEVQGRYDVAYVQCMYAKGNQVPISGQYSGVIPHGTAAPTLSTPPSPPAGDPPPPPPPPPSTSVGASPR